MQKLLRLTAFIFFVLMMKTASSQNNYINHTLKTGETLSVLAKQYNTNVGDIMRMNGMHADTKLVYGSVIKIPSAKTNTINTQPTQTAKPNTIVLSDNVVKHTVVKGETLYSISKKYNVSIEQLKARNHLAGNSTKLGSSLIVGMNNNSSTVLKKPEADTKRQRVESTQQTQQIQQTATQLPHEATVINTAEEKKTNDADITTSETVNNQTITPAEKNNTSTSIVPQNGEGYFENQFTVKNKHKKHISGVSKTFKTSSGWSDGKYYILADNINPGTIVKLTADNGKSVYAKVLWNMSDLKENNDIDFRVSNATAAALNENNPSFNLTIYY